MERETIKQKLTAIFQDVLDSPSLALQDSMTAADVDGWDSLSHIHLIYAVETEFKIKLTTAEVLGLHNVGDFISLIEKKTA